MRGQVGDGHSRISGDLPLKADGSLAIGDDAIAREALAGALALTGTGIGATVVPITSSVMGAVPPEHSGMAASAANTSREVGAVTGVAILGALVDAQLKADLTSKLHQLGIPVNFQSIVINALETGGVPPSGKTAGAGGAAAAGQGKLVREVINAAYHAFQTGLHAALYLSAGLVIGAGILAVATLGKRQWLMR